MPQVEIRIWPEANDLDAIEYLAFIRPDFDVIPDLPNLKAMFSRSAGVEAFINAFSGASLTAVRRGFLSIGVEDNSILIFSELMDSASLFLTANCDTVYFVGCIDLTDGPMVLDVPPFGPPSGILGTIDDMWFRWITDIGLPGPDRGFFGRF